MGPCLGHVPTPYALPLIEPNGVKLPVVKNWEHATDGKVYGSVTDNNNYD